MNEWMRQKYAKLPTVGNGTVASPWGAIEPVSNEPPSAVAVCGRVSWFIHITGRRPGRAPSRA